MIILLSMNYCSLSTKSVFGFVNFGLFARIKKKCKFLFESKFYILFSMNKKLKTWFFAKLNRTIFSFNVKKKKSLN